MGDSFRKTHVVPANAGTQCLLQGCDSALNTGFVVPAPDSSIRGQASAGIHFASVKNQWIPAWPFLETPPFGLVFAGMTILGIRASRALVMLNQSTPCCPAV